MIPGQDLPVFCSSDCDTSVFFLRDLNRGLYFSDYMELENNTMVFYTYKLQFYSGFRAAQRWHLFLSLSSIFWISSLSSEVSCGSLRLMQSRRSLLFSLFLLLAAEPV